MVRIASFLDKAPESLGSQVLSTTLLACHLGSRRPSYQCREVISLEILPRINRMWLEWNQINPLTYTISKIILIVWDYFIGAHFPFLHRSVYIWVHIWCIVSPYGALCATEINL